MTENNSNESTKKEPIEGDVISSDEAFMKSEDESNRPVFSINKEVIREDMVKTAINFLLNPRVIDSPLTQKRTFLLKKGLSLEEIDLAIDRCSRLTRNQNQPLQPINGNSYSQQQMNGPLVVQPMPSFLSRSTYMVSNVALFGGFVYGVYVFYKRFIEPLIFEKSRKPHPFVTIQLQLDQLSKAMDVLKDSVSTIEINIKKQIEEEIRVNRAPQDITIHELKSDLASIKALLVNRRQFTATPVGAIPLWQMNDKTDNQNTNDTEKLVNGSEKIPNNDNSEDNDNHNLTNGSAIELNCTETNSKSELQD